MGNGESTTRHLCMQRTDEGTIQISEDVMLRLSRQKTVEENAEPELQLAAGEKIVHEDNLRLMLEKAFDEGKKQELGKSQKEKEAILKEKEAHYFNLEHVHAHKVKELELYWKTLLREREEHAKLTEEQMLQLEEQRKQKHAEIEAFWKSQLEEKDMVVDDIQKIAEEQRQKAAKIEVLWKNQLDEKEKVVDDIQKMAEEQTQRVAETEALWRNQLDEKVKAVDEMQKVAEEEKQKTVELETFWKRQLEENDTIVEEMQKTLVEQTSSVEEMKNKLSEERRLLQEKVMNREKELKGAFNSGVQDVEQMIRPLQQSPICTEHQAKVLDCYRLNRTKPLKCSQEVKDFVQCVQATRLKTMQMAMVNNDEEHSDASL